MKSLLLTFGIVALASQAFAYPGAPKPYGPGPAGIPNRKMSTDDQARQTTNDYAVCMVKRYSKKVEQALSRPTLAESYLALAKIADADCLFGAQLAMPPELFRGAAFRALYMRDFRSDNITYVRNRIDFLAEAGSDQRLRDQATLKAYADCVVHQSPNAARAFLLSAVASPEERGAIKELRPALADCLRDGKIKISFAVLQSALAEVMYREAQPSFSASKQ